MPMAGNYLAHVTIVLHRPRFPENVGASARAARNMGISRLVLVEPENCDLTRVVRMATHAALDVVENMEVFSDLRTALKPQSPVLTVSSSGGQITLSWPNSTPGVFALETTTNLTPVISWSSVTNSGADDGTNNYVTITPLPDEAARFYRLRRP